MVKIFYDTPIEEYNINGKDIFVKREDLFLQEFQPKVPALAKLRGAGVVLRKMKEDGIERVAVFDTRISKSGQGIAFLCKELGMHCLVGFPKLKYQTFLNEPQAIAKELGADVLAVQAGRTAPCYSIFKKEALSRGYCVLPLGITFKETAEEVAKVSASCTKGYNSIIVSTGTGTIACGIALGTEVNVFGISCGMNIVKQQYRILTICNGLGKMYPKNLRLIQTGYDYYQGINTERCPFPTSPYYDMKAWNWLLTHINDFKEPILFWNIGV